MGKGGWDEDYISEQELKKDNEILKEQLGISEKPFHKAIQLTPYIEHQFLKYIKEFVDMDRGPKRELSTLFPPDFEFPPAESLSSADVAYKLAQIKSVLEAHNIRFEFGDSIPATLIYEYFLNEELHSEIALEFPEGVTYYINGCNGLCPECFQREYCESNVTTKMENVIVRSVRKKDDAGDI